MTLLTVLEVTGLVTLVLYLLNSYGPLKPEANKAISMIVASATILVVLVWAVLALVGRFG